jgi:hypothetical protein
MAGRLHPGMRLHAGDLASITRFLKPRDSLTSRGASLTAPASDTRPVIESANDFIAAILGLGRRLGRA